MHTIELFTRDSCKKPCDDARNYVNQAVQMLKAEGIPVAVEEYNVDTHEGRIIIYSRIEIKARKMNMAGFPLIVIDDEPYFSNMTTRLAGNIHRIVRGHVDYRS